MTEVSEHERMAGMESEKKQRAAAVTRQRLRGKLMLPEFKALVPGVF